MFSYNDAFSSFSVDDLQKAKAFYHSILGLEVTEQTEGLDLKTVGSSVFIYPKANHQPASFTVLNFKVANIEQTVDDLAGKGVKFEHYSGQMQTDAKGIMRGNGPTIAWYKDPAGNFLSIIQA